MPVRLSRREFENLVIEVLDELPDDILRLLDNVDIVVAAWPTREQLERAGVPPGETLLGLYEGVPLTERGLDYGFVLPDKITLFQGPLQELAHTREELREEIRRTILHELAHHFGISDERLQELDAY